MKLGIDIGSTSLKGVLLNAKNEILFKKYMRHHASIIPTLLDFLEAIEPIIKTEKFQIVFTGSIGMGISERLQLTFVQEVIASIAFIQENYPEVQTFIDIGGEDSKMIFFSENRQPDIRMNGSCAGGTGAFIDQMSTLLGIPMEEIDEYATKAETIYPIASRCGVFAKTDVQNLVANNVDRPTIVGSVFHSLALQVITSLSRGYKVIPPLFFSGGPFAYLPHLKKTFLKILQFDESEVISYENPELVPAYGAALSANAKTPCTSLSELKALIQKLKEQKLDTTSNLPVLFHSKEEFADWQKEKQNCPIKKCEPNRKNEHYFLGIDSGSTTTKIVIINEKKEIVYSYYDKNVGDSISTFTDGIQDFQKEIADDDFHFTSAAVTGYGENLLKTAFHLPHGIVETMAHYIAAQYITPNVDFILDIGGQDMKAIFISHGNIKNIEINEACSSGCGSFIDGFANMLNMNVSDFALLACQAKSPCDLGTRCTVFMNSKVKQALREGNSVEDVAAGLSYSVVKNCLYKVLKIKSNNELGENIVVQGGTFKNPSVIRSLELLTGKKVFVSSVPELMGAYGAALFSLQQWEENEEVKSDVSLNGLLEVKTFTSTSLHCKGCENRCTVKKHIFSNQAQFYSGNKCEKVFSNMTLADEKGENFHAIKYQMLFGEKGKLTKPQFIMGIPRGLIFYEDFPFWHTLLTACNIQPLLSGATTIAQYEKGIQTIMADNICFPAKLMHGHIMYLIKKNVDRILYPYIIYERKEDKTAANSYNCPIVTGYSDVLISSIATEENYQIPLDAPVLNFNDEDLLTKALLQYLSQFNIAKTRIKDAISKALKVQEQYEYSLKETVSKLYNKAIREQKTVILLAGRPYHIDPLIQHKISEAIAEMGAVVINEDIVRFSRTDDISHKSLVNQWAFPNRIIKAARWVTEQPSHVHFVQLTSFGCGPDAFINDEIKEILESKGKSYTLLKVDDVNNIGSLKLRIRSLLESHKVEREQLSYPMKTTPIFELKDQHRTIIAPYFAENYSELLPPLFQLMGMDLEILPPSDEQSNNLGLQYANNEICYPATLVIGDIIKALESGKYDPHNIAVAITQTGGQCRASSYISMIKRAIIARGFDSIPVVAVSLGSVIFNEQPGFQLKWHKLASTALYALLFVDALSKLYYPSAVREIRKGEAKRVQQKYLNLAKPLIAQKQNKELLLLIQKAAAEFELIIDPTIKTPIIGVVGEIYVKYNSFSHKNVVNWLIEQGIEVVAPSLYNFFICEFVNLHIKKELHIKKTSFPQFLTDFLFKRVEKIAEKFDNAASSFPFYRSFADLEKDALNASKVINLAAQFGEGWLIPAEIASFAESNINNVISLQPFGCIANHVISKGIEKRIKKTHPKINLLFLDFDGGTSDANVMNRLHFMVEHAKKSVEKDTPRIK